MTEVMPFPKQHEFEFLRSCVGSAGNGELAFPVSEYTAIFGGPVGRTPPNAVAAGGTGSR